MFGDIGHGFLLFCVGVWLCFKKDYILEHVKPLFLLLKARYLILLMGFFATFCGFIYNDMMSLPLDLFGTCFKNNPEN